MDASYVVALLACPVGMGLMMWVMMRGRRGDGHGAGHGDGEQSTARDMAQDTEIQRLRDELDELWRAQRGQETSGVERD